MRSMRELETSNLNRRGLAAAVERFYETTKACTSFESLRGQKVVRSSQSRGKFNLRKSVA